MGGKLIPLFLSPPDMTRTTLIADDTDLWGEVLERARVNFRGVQVRYTSSPLTLRACA